MPQSFVVDAVVAAVKELAGFPRLRVLDLSCGEAEILNRLKSLGCEVQGTHYRADDYIVENRKGLANVPVVSGVDLHKPLPFEDASFQVVILSEVLEHLEWHGTVIREAGRVLKPGGHLLFTTPNIFRLHSRLQFFFTGKHKLIERRLGWDASYGDRSTRHIFPPPPRCLFFFHPQKHKVSEGCSGWVSRSGPPPPRHITPVDFPLIH